MDITLDFKSKRVQGTVTLPASKSISNRVLIVNALADSELPIENLADCDDTQSMCGYCVVKIAILMWGMPGQRCVF